MRVLARVVVAALSAGWIVPCFLAGISYLRHVADVSSTQAGTPLNSFPFLHFSEQMLTLSGAWLFMVVLAWSYVASAFIGKWEPNKLLHATSEDARA